MIGGGAVGASAAWHLRELGIEDVLLVERDSLGSGSTSKSAGGVRMQFADELNVRIAQRSFAELERMDGIDLRRTGYLFLVDRAEDLDEFRAALALQQRLGVPSRELSVAEALELVPQLEPEGLLGATFCPLDGHCTPEAVVQWYARGLHVLQGCEVTRDRRARRARPGCRDDPRTNRHGHRGLLRRGLGGRDRRAGRSRDPRSR